MFKGIPALFAFSGVNHGGDGEIARRDCRAGTHADLTTVPRKVVILLKQNRPVRSSPQKKNTEPHPNGYGSVLVETERIELLTS